MFLLTANLLDDGVKALIKDGIVALESNEVRLTGKGERILQTILLEKFYKEIVAVAKTQIADSEKKAEPKQ